MPSKDLVREVALLEPSLAERLAIISKENGLGKGTIMRRALRYFLNKQNSQAFDHFILNAHDITD
jgi:hypothetical protein